MIETPPPARGFASRYAVALTAALIFITLVPACFDHETPGMTHLGSTVHAFEYYYDNGFQFGHDVIDNVGPYGFYHYPSYYYGGAFYSKMLIFMSIIFLYSYFAASLAMGFDIPIARAVSVVFFAYIPYQAKYAYLSYEVFPNAVVLLSSLWLLDRIRKPLRQTVPHIAIIAATYAFLSLEKTSNFYFCAFSILVISGYALYYRFISASLTLVLSFLATIIGLWIAAGQWLAHLHEFLFNSIKFAAVYQEAMAEPSSQSEFYCSLALALIILIYLAFRLSAARKCGADRIVLELTRTMLISTALFVAWKHAMIGSDFHTGIFFELAACVSPIVIFHGYNAGYNATNPAKGAASRKWRLAWLAVFILVIMVSYRIDTSLKRNRSFDMLKEAKERAVSLLSYKPLRAKTDLDNALNEFKRLFAVPPSVRAAIANAPVDEYGENPDITLLNGMNFRPRPVSIDFIAISEEFMRLNAGYYANDATAPEFIFASIGEGMFSFNSNPKSIPAGDTLAFLEMLFRYKPFSISQYWLIMKRAGAHGHIEMNPTGRLTAGLGKTITFSPSGSGLVWCKLDIKYNLFGKLRRFFFKPPHITMSYTNNRGTSYKIFLRPMAARIGFPVNPMIVDIEGLYLYYSNPRALPQIRTIRIDAEDGDRFVEQEITVETFNVRFVPSPAD